MENQRILLFGATGAVGGETLKALLALPQVAKVTALGRRKADVPVGLDPSDKLVQEAVDLNDPPAYAGFLRGHSHALCALGVGQPSKMTREEFVRIDRDLVLSIARACREAGVTGFSLLSAVGANAESFFFYSKLKGQLEEGLRELGFERLRLFQPSMILTPTNRYGSLQGFLLRFWPLLNPVLMGPLSKVRGIRVEELGKAMALNAVTDDELGVKTFHWADFKSLIQNDGSVE